jgi:uncharacterized protein (TIGR03435 family)
MLYVAITCVAAGIAWHVWSPDDRATRISNHAAAVEMAQAANDRAQRAPTFDAASVRRNESGGRPGGIRPLPTGRFTAINVTLRDLILRAYDLHESQLIGGPAWINSERFDVVANTEVPPPDGTRDVMLMLRGLLDQRFALRLRTERRSLPTYSMSLARTDRRLGPQLRISTIDCTMNPASPAPNAVSIDSQGWPPCGLALVRSMVGTVRTRVEAKHSAVTMQQFAVALQRVVGRPVLDRTSLAGTFDVEYAYSQENSTTARAAAGPSDLPDVFTALQEQLGLKLEPGHDAVEVLAIDSVEKPAAN